MSPIQRQRTCWLCAAALLLLAVTGCDQLLVPQARVTGGLDSEGMAAAQQALYVGPRARLAVVAIENKSGKGGRIGEGMAEMLVTELVNTNRYVILERQELGGVIAEQDLATAGRVEPGTEAPTGQIAGADLLVFGALTEFEPNFQATSGAFRNRKYGSLVLHLRQAHLALDLRLVDARTSQIVSATSVEGRATDLAADIFTRVGGGSSRMGIGLAGYRNQPMEKAIRVGLAKAVQFIVAQTPPVYYRYDASGQPIVPWAGQAQGPAVLPQPTPTGPPPAPNGPATPPDTASAATVYVVRPNARVFHQPTVRSPVVTGVPPGIALRVDGQQGSWYAVRLPDGRRGWIAATLTSPTPPQTP
jgi:curli biogenesis system outer membrane secretion channel CsgG